MENALLVGLSAQMALRRNMEIISNNLANASTSGFKREAPVFEELMVPVDSDTPSVKEISFVRDWGVVRDMTEGPLEQTGAPLDIAIEGKGFLIVRTPQGERYTRDGHLKLDAQGRIVTSDGNPVLSDGGEITIPPGESSIKIANDGTVSTSQGTAGKFRVVTFADSAMKKEGKNLYTAEGAPSPAEKTRVMQGMVERSNVEAVVEMTKMIEVMRAYQHSTETLNATDDLIRRATQKLGEVKV
ncbi:MAG: flagellar basal-body rod protein FlgF [Alphaproteobacteria bacterium]|nr:flagellar basal-body rod protein FlgF [Alphaproteobacteria bacterium]